MSKNDQNTVKNAEKPANMTKNRLKYRKTVKTVEKQENCEKMLIKLPKM